MAALQPLEDINSDSGAANGSNTEESLLEKIQSKFGNEIKTAFEREEITDDAAIKDLAYREADTPIFTRLGLTYGKAMKFRKEFGEHVQSLQSRPSSPPVKPTMAAIASFSPEMRRLYLSKRKRVGVMATEKWGPKFPKFNSPQMKAELNEFSAKITPVCGIPEVGFNEEGIAKHVQDFCNEQRRYDKLKNSKSASCEYNNVEDRPRGTKTKQKSTSSEDDDVEELPRKKKTEQKPVKIKASATPPNGVKKIRPTTTLDKTLEQDAASTSSESGESLSTLSVDSRRGSESESMIKDSGTPKEDKCSSDIKAPTTVASLQVVIKAIFGKLLTREETVGILKSKFMVKNTNLTPLTPSQLMQVLVKKLVRNNYVTLKGSLSSLQKSNVTVHKEIQM
ncbi:hypothetical protein OS493_000645 [Desmophyllum pertusum]|uniref:Uncharacterized protein n=1 Tax=Desmophyllum pertusum TaxID=174260 RepID=A0A9X0DCQ1_9CNID|nr:hypothetical protein OS493_000645 [Desmophyllum pertusum]